MIFFNGCMDKLTIPQRNTWLINIMFWHRGSTSISKILEFLFFFIVLIFSYQK
jgi:hypothetical protein